MRQLEEICKDIGVINNQINILTDRKEVLYKEKRDRLFADFCEQYGIKRGDIVELCDTNHTQVQVVGFDRNWGNWLVCHKIKKNGEPYLSTTTFSKSRFNGCKVIKHTDL